MKSSKNLVDIRNHRKYSIPSSLSRGIDTWNDGIGAVKSVVSLSFNIMSK